MLRFTALPCFVRFSVFVSSEIIIVNYISRSSYSADDFRYNSAVFRSIDGKFTYLICPCCRCFPRKSSSSHLLSVKPINSTQSASALRVIEHHIRKVCHDHAAVDVSMNNPSFTDIDSAVGNAPSELIQQKIPGLHGLYFITILLHV